MLLKFKQSTTKPIQETQSSICKWSILNNISKNYPLVSKRKIAIHNNPLLCIIILILSNDINPNPGPMQNINNCHTCKEEIIHDSQYLKCETCSKQYHVTCQEINSKPVPKHNYFEWICSTKKCLPNHQKLFLLSNLQMENRYNNLMPNENLPIASHDILQDESINLTPAELENVKWLKELPAISPKQYEGKCACRVCHKEVKEKHRAVSCDICDMWSHLNCSDISIKLYNNLKHQHYFMWTCTKCRVDEQPILETIDVNDLDLNGQPDEISMVKSKRNELVIINMNCRSILNKQEELEHIINETGADIIILTETWMDDSVPKQSYVPDGYKILRKDRCSDFKQKYGKNKGGGIALLYKEKIKIEKKEYLTEEIEEIMWVHVKIKQSFMLGIIYRAEYTKTLEETLEETIIENNIKRASEISKNIIIGGDFNVDMLNKDNKLTKLLKDIYKSYGLSQVIKKPTRFDKKSSKGTCIDHFWVNDSELLNINTHGTFIGLSDHLGTYLKMNKGKIPDEIKTIRCRNYKNYDKLLFNEKLKENLNNSCINELVSQKDVNRAMEKLMSVIQDTLATFAPITEIQIKNKRKYIPWYTDDLKALITEKNHFIADSFIYGFEIFKSRIKQLTNNINHLKRKLKKDYLKTQLSLHKEDPKKSWETINSITDNKKCKDKIEPDMMNQSKANDFNIYFANVGKEIQEKLKLTTNLNNFDGLAGFQFQPENIETIKKYIDSLKINTSTGYDDISAKILKDSSETLAPLICQILNLSFEMKQFPDCMKRATITALHKKKDTNIISNYRPLSILPSLSKILERSATTQLAEFLEKNDILSRNQHAYRRRHGTVTCLSEVVDCLYDLIDQKKHVAIISLDLSKAFDSISHELLLNKLSKMGLGESSILWIKSYLTNRYQVTKFKEFTSSEQLITAGVPQGSIIGPLLFLCFTNDLYQAFDSSCSIVSYADDTQIIVNTNNQNQLKTLIKNTIIKAQKWYSENSMQNNIDKTEILMINPKNKLNKTKFTIKDNGKKIKLKPASSIKVLGIYIDENLNWSKQINCVKRNALNSIRHLHRINHLLPVDLRIQLYYSLVVPHFDYADIIWGGCGSVNTKKLQITQNFAVRSITGTKKHDSVRDSFEKLKFLNLQQRRTIHEAVFTNKSLLHLNPVKISLKYNEQISTSHRNTRSSHMGTLNLPKHNSAKFQNSPFFRCISSWNACPNNLPTYKPKPFKKSLQKHLIHETYKS